MKTHLLAALATFALVTSGPASLLAQEPASPPAPAGTDSVDALIRAVYRTVSFPAGTTPDWDRLRELMLPNALIVQPASRGRGIKTVDVDGFVQLFVDDIEKYRMSEAGFAERVVATEVTAYGNMASAFVVFEARMLRGPGTRPQRGLDVFQLVETGGRWWIASIATQFERPAEPIPERIFAARFLEQVDHLVYATPDVDATTDQLAELLGARPVAGGIHPGKGTRNALLSLGASTYLEIIGPDPGQPDPTGGRAFGIDGLTKPRLVTWVAKESDAGERALWASAQGIDLGAVELGSRRRPDGTLLSWRATDPDAPTDRLVPFFIQWETGEHPATTSPTGCTLLGLRAEHPEPDRARDALRALGLGLVVDRGASQRLIATIRSPRGVVELE